MPFLNAFQSALFPHLRGQQLAPLPIAGNRKR